MDGENVIYLRIGYLYIGQTETKYILTELARTLICSEYKLCEPPPILAWASINPTRVGMNRGTQTNQERLANINPTRVGMNRVAPVQLFLCCYKPYVCGNKLGHKHEPPQPPF